MGTSAARAFCAAASAEPDGRIGLSRFSDDVWDLRPYVGPEQSAKMRRLDFTCFAAGPTKDLFQRWCRWRLGKVKASLYEKSSVHSDR